MIKNLRYFMMSALMLICGSAFAEDIIWAEDWSGVTEFKVNPSGFQSNYSFTGFQLNDDQSFKSGTTFYNEALAGGEAPELLIAKNGGSFTVSPLPLGDRSGDMFLSFKSNKKLTVTVEGATLGEATNAGNDYVYPLTVEEGQAHISITFTMETSANARLDNIKLYQGTAKKPAGLSWGKASTTVTLGSTDNLPELQNSNNLFVTFTSSNTDVATIDEQGTIDLLSVGKTVLTAAFEGNDEYEAQSVSIEMTVREGTPDNPDPQTETITVAQALEIINALEDGKTTEETYQIKGYVVAVTEISAQYGNATFTIADEKGGQNVLTVFRSKGFNGANITDENILKVDDEVVVEGKLQKYVKDGNMTPEVAQGGKIISINGQTGGETPPEPQAEQVTVAKALEIIDALENGKTTTETYRVKGYVVSVTEISMQYGNATFTIADEQGGQNVLTVFRAKGFDGENITDENLLKVDDEVIVEGKLQKYVKNDNVTPELAQGGKIISINGQGSANISNIEYNAQQGRIYNLQGQRVDKAVRGLYIIDGKKMLVK
jgi:hypothetical protein